MRTAACIAFSLAAFFAVAGLINRASPYPIGRYSDALTEKLLYFKDHKDIYDVAFFGSSTVFAGVIPERFDAAMAASGVPVRSFNFGMNAMRSHEADSVIRRVLAMKPSRLRWTIVEAGRWTGRIFPGLEYRPRTILWHDLRTTLAAIRSSSLNVQAADQRRDLVLSHWLHFGAYATALGRGPQAVNTQLRRFGGPHYPRWLITHQGYREPAWSRKKFLSQLDDYEMKVERLGSVRGRLASSLDGFDAQAVEGQIAALRRASIEPVLLVPPLLGARPELLLLEKEGIIEHLLAFNDPVAYPELYRLEHRWDSLHLNAAGAEEFSNLLAGRLAAIVGATSETGIGD